MAPKSRVAVDRAAAENAVMHQHPLTCIDAQSGRVCNAPPAPSTISMRLGETWPAVCDRLQDVLSGPNSIFMGRLTSLRLDAGRIEMIHRFERVRTTLERTDVLDDSSETPPSFTARISGVYIEPPVGHVTDFTLPGYEPATPGMKRRRQM